MAGIIQKIGEKLNMGSGGGGGAEHKKEEEEKQHELVEEKHKEVMEQIHELEEKKQHELVEEKHKDVMDELHEVEEKKHKEGGSTLDQIKDKIGHGGGGDHKDGEEKNKQDVDV